MRLIAAGIGLLGLAVAAQTRPDRITPDTVERLAVRWTYDTRESTEPLRPGTDRPAFEATPVYADDRLYLSTPGGLVIALDADTGKEIWRVDLKIRRDANYSDFASRGVAVADDLVYAATVDARLVCLNRDGRFCERFGSRGQVDLTEGLRRKPEWAGEYGVTSPPAVYRDLLIVGSSVADNSRARMASGEVRAFDRRSGALRWTFHPLPEKTNAGGANTWSRIVVDDTNGLVFLPTGSPSPDYFGDSVLATTGRPTPSSSFAPPLARWCGRFRPFTTTSGTTTSRRHHCCFLARKARRWRLDRRRATSFFSSV